MFDFFLKFFVDSLILDYHQKDFVDFVVEDFMIVGKGMVIVLEAITFEDSFVEFIFSDSEIVFKQFESLGEVFVFVYHSFKGLANVPVFLFGSKTVLFEFVCFLA